MLYANKQSKYFRAIRGDVVSRLPNELGVILDIGGGEGATSNYLIETGRASESIVIDPFVNREDAARLTFWRRSAEDWSLYDELRQEGRRFDTILCLDVLGHLVDPWMVLREGLRESVWVEPDILEDGRCLRQLAGSSTGASAAGPRAPGRPPEGLGPSG